MPRGRHRHSPPLHRLLPPAAVAVAALACAGGTWLVGEPGVGDLDTVVLRALATAAAAAAVTGSVLLRRWDRAAGRQVGDLKARMASTAWRAEEKQAELEGEAEELREVRDKLVGKLRGKRAELTRLRSEHADLLRRYAHAETRRASALEGRRLLELESGAPAGGSRALTKDATDHRRLSGAPTPLTYLRADEALTALARNVVRQRAAAARRDADREDLPEPSAPAPGADRDRAGSATPKAGSAATDTDRATDMDRATDTDTDRATDAGRAPDAVTDTDDAAPRAGADAAPGTDAAPDAGAAPERDSGADAGPGRGVGWSSGPGPMPPARVVPGADADGSAGADAVPAAPAGPGAPASPVPPQAKPARRRDPDEGGAEPDGREGDTGAFDFFGRDRRGSGSRS
ncbi:hypothetical protein MMF93_18570 [Streptomyces tubbatahanensis]|uniref:Secreted protein n=1 Tax=Streptomyces tubbatahanensis TaxID=2923272 RepID=A0ABY3XUR8_9ACTN|nr:hypothetical protein [Streptomyces tubbatahanensis]UNS98233.1 hypothetical protein MMF93_18570 [Streptomyces tubbatahanensis]